MGIATFNRYASGEGAGYFSESDWQACSRFTSMQLPVPFQIPRRYVEFWPVPENGAEPVLKGLVQAGLSLKFVLLKKVRHPLQSSPGGKQLSKYRKPNGLSFDISFSASPRPICHY